MRRSRTALLAGSFALTGCAADLGTGAGVETQSAHAIGFGRAAVSMRVGSPLNEHGLLVGATVESRAEASEGSRWTGGVMLGGGFGPSALGGSPLGFNGYFEAGTPLRAVLLKNWEHYLGLGFEVPIRLSTRRNIQDLNDSSWILLRRFEVVPFARMRLHHDYPQGGDLDARFDVSGGVSFRMRIFTDVF
jgi:hypothetical protein